MAMIWLAFYCFKCRIASRKKCVCVCVCVCAKLLQSCLTLYHPMDCSTRGSSVPGDSPGKNAGVGSHFLLQGIFLTQGPSSYLLCHLRWKARSYFFFFACLFVLERTFNSSAILSMYCLKSQN